MDNLLLTKCLRCKGAMTYDKFTVPMSNFGDGNVRFAGRLLTR
jgi:hypothetical protein